MRPQPLNKDEKQLTSEHCHSSGSYGLFKDKEDKEMEVMLKSILDESINHLSLNIFKNNVMQLY